VPVKLFVVTEVQLGAANSVLFLLSEQLLNLISWATTHLRTGVLHLW